MQVNGFKLYTWNSIWYQLFFAHGCSIINDYCPVGRGCRLYRLYLFRGVGLPQQWPSRVGLLNTPTASLQIGKIPTNECPKYNSKQSVGEVQVILELWVMQSTPLLPLFQDPLWSEMIAPDRVPSIGQIELNCVHMLNWFVFNRAVFDIETEYSC